MPWPKGMPTWNKGLKLTPQHRKHLSEAKLGKKGKLSNGFKNGRYTASTKYILVLVENHPHKNNDGYVYEHRLVMEEMIGRYLEPQERVHHLNGQKDDNRPENLVLFSNNSEHCRNCHKMPHKTNGEFSTKN